MRLTRFTDNALRCLVVLGLEPEGTHTVAEVAARMQMSEEHLTKVVQRLAQSGYVVTVRGRRGGVRLARPAGEIRVGAVVRDAEDDMSLVPCFDEPASCPIAPACRLASALDAALAAFLGVLDGMTLDDMLSNRTQLVPLIARPRARGAAASAKAGRAR